jgi:hypothetical protein
VIHRIVERVGLVLLAFACVGNVFANSQPKSIRFVPESQVKTGALSDSSHVEISGVIDASSPRVLARALEVALKKTTSSTLSGDPIIDVYLDSPGGSVSAGIAMGKLLRQYAAVAWVNKGAMCASSCVFVLAGGVQRNLVNNGQIIIHRPYFEPDMFGKLDYSESQGRYAVVTEIVRKYLTEMGMDERLFNEMMRVPSNDGVLLGRDYAETLRLVGKDPAYEEWIRARIKLHRGDEYLERIDRYTSCIENSKTPNGCDAVFPRPSE